MCLFRIAVCGPVRCAVFTLAWDGKAHLVTFVPFFLVKLRQRVSHGLVIFGTVAEDVDSKVNGVAEGLLISNSLACQRKTVGYFCRSTDKRQSCRIIDAPACGESTEGGQSLFVIHCQYTVELPGMAAAEERVRRIGTENLDALVGKLVDSRRNKILFF